MKPIRVFLVCFLLSVASVDSVGQPASSITNCIGMHLVLLHADSFMVGQDGPQMGRQMK